ncbi:hypothetical protein Phum_PHUM057050 [Pediculus humanus corporis]|uniref:Uncharacterized protein n=1 Tax=Pediculus humanus subsp. corporis TaxID=121224 RepID=E0VBC0_PEDHC|nr:uncharacterized protein Phum_PHUM057050 [Pediculus humanus corporis]EEB10676.1 hypothetical protein Phum_PHUM057050 [Pediculus humanus corporis]
MRKKQIVNENVIHTFPDSESTEKILENFPTGVTPMDDNLEDQLVISMDNYQDEEDRKAMVTRPVGLAIYVLAAFGIVPLILAVAFASRFLMQRFQRRVCV